MLNLVSLSTQSLASCVNYFVWNCLTCFSNTKIGSVTSFSILFNFQGPVRRSLSGWRLDYFTTEAVFCQALFWEAFELFWTWSASYISVSTGVFQRLLVLFKGFLLRFQKSLFCLSAWRSSIIPHPRTIVNTFWHLFSNFFAEQKTPPFSPIIITVFSWQGGGQNVLWSHSSILYDVAILII